MFKSSLKKIAFVVPLALLAPGVFAAPDNNNQQSKAVVAPKKPEKLILNYERSDFTVKKAHEADQIQKDKRKQPRFRFETGTVRADKTGTAEPYYWSNGQYTAMDNTWTCALTGVNSIGYAESVFMMPPRTSVWDSTVNVRNDTDYWNIWFYRKGDWHPRINWTCSREIID